VPGTPATHSSPAATRPWPCSTRAQHRTRAGRSAGRAPPRPPTCCVRARARAHGRGCARDLRTPAPSVPQQDMRQTTELVAGWQSRTVGSRSGRCGVRMAVVVRVGVIVRGIHALALHRRTAALCVCIYHLRRQWWIWASVFSRQQAQECCTSRPWDGRGYGE
jgi:hypothetical protein